MTAGLRWSKEEETTQFDQYYSLFSSTTGNTGVEQDWFGLGSPVWSYGNGQYSNRGIFVFDNGDVPESFVDPTDPNEVITPLIENTNADTDIDDDFFTWKLGLDWQASDDTLVYASYNRGIKAGGFNAPLDATLYVYGFLAPDEMQFDKETLDAFEIGFKTDLWDGRARLNGAMYYYDYQDYQAFNLESLTLFVFNTDATNKGFELELQASPTEGLDLLLGVAYVDTEVEDAYSPDGVNTIDREMIMTPEWTFNGMFRYEWPVGQGSLAAQYDFSYMDDHFFQLKNSPVGAEDSYMLSNIRLTYTSGNGDWEISGFVNNVTDEKFRQMVFDLSGTPAEGGFGMAEHYFGKPRWWGASFTYRWGD